MRLFQRLNPGLALTDEGRRYLEAVDAALAQLEAAQDLLAPRPRPLRVSALESFSESWLVPNLPDFERAHPDVEIELEATLRYADFERDAVDVAIRFGRGPVGGSARRADRRSRLLPGVQPGPGRRGSSAAWAGRPRAPHADPRRADARRLDGVAARRRRPGARRRAAA